MIRFVLIFNFEDVYWGWLLSVIELVVVVLMLVVVVVVILLPVLTNLAIKNPIVSVWMGLNLCYSANQREITIRKNNWMKEDEGIWDGAEEDKDSRVTWTNLLSSAVNPGPIEERGDILKSKEEAVISNQ